MVSVLFLVSIFIYQVDSGMSREIDFSFDMENFPEDPVQVIFPICR